MTAEIIGGIALLAAIFVPIGWALYWAWEIW